MKQEVEKVFSKMRLASREESIKIMHEELLPLIGIGCSEKERTENMAAMIEILFAELWCRNG